MWWRRLNRWPFSCVATQTTSSRRWKASGSIWGVSIVWIMPHDDGGMRSTTRLVLQHGPTIPDNSCKHDTSNCPAFLVDFPMKTGFSTGFFQFSSATCGTLIELWSPGSSRDARCLQWDECHALGGSSGGHWGHGPQRLPGAMTATFDPHPRWDDVVSFKGNFRSDGLENFGNTNSQDLTWQF